MEENESIYGSTPIVNYDPGRSLCRDVDILSQEMKQLCDAVRELARCKHSKTPNSTRPSGRLMVEDQSSARYAAKCWSSALPRKR
jgi:hypothetical protein